MHPEQVNPNEDFMQGIQNMIESLAKDSINKMQKKELNNQLGIVAQEGAEDGDAEPNISLQEVKVMINTMIKFINSMKMMIAQLEGEENEYRRDEDKFMDDYMNIADNILGMAAFSTKDKLTGLSNQSGFEHRLVFEWNRATRDKTPLSLLVFGVQSEEKQGDEVLKEVSETLKQTIKRSTDFSARWDNDTFAVLLPVTNADGSMIVAERLLEELEKLTFTCAVSIGLTVQTSGENSQPADFIDRARSAYAKSKQAGSNVIVLG